MNNCSQVTHLTAAGLTLSRGDLFVAAMSQFVAQCQRPAALHDVSQNDFDDELAALLSELCAALEQLSVESVTTGQTVRQLRLLDEPATYTAS